MALPDTPDTAAFAVLVTVVAQIEEIKYEAGGALQPQLDQLIGQIRGLMASIVAAERPSGPVGPPVNIDAPYIEQVGSVLSSTSGNWQDPPPDSYQYQWQSDGVDIATGSSYPVQPADVGTTFVCIVTAVNAAGSTASPPSNAVVAA